MSADRSISQRTSSRPGRSAKLGAILRAGSVGLRWLARQEGLVLLLALGVVLAVWGFTELADEVLEGERQDLDEAVLRLLRRPDDPRAPSVPAWLIDAALDLTALGGPVILPQVPPARLARV